MNQQISIMLFAYCDILGRLRPKMHGAKGVRFCSSKSYEPKYPKAALLLQKTVEELMASFDFPANIGRVFRTSNPILNRPSPRSDIATKRSKGWPIARWHAAHDVQCWDNCAEQKLEEATRL